MNITADTNLFVRLVAEDDEAQFAQARAVLDQAVLIAVPLPVLCEFAWVLRGRLPRDEIADAIESLILSTDMITDRDAARAGLATLREGGDFADGAIAQSGAALGGHLFVSFDRHAVALRRAAGGLALTPNEFGPAV